MDEKLKEGIKSLGKTPSSKDIINLFITPFPKGLRKVNLKFGKINDWTLYTTCNFFINNLYFRWQLMLKNGKFIWQKNPDICKYE